MGGFRGEIVVVEFELNGSDGSKNRAARPLFDGGTRQRMHRYVQKRLQ